MALDDKIEAVKKVSEALKDKSGYEEMDRVSANKEHFHNLIDASTLTTQPSFQRIDGTNVAPDGVKGLEQNPIVAEGSVKVQGNGTATDQDSRKKTHPIDEDEVIVKKPGSLMDEVRNLNTQVINVAKLSPTDIQNQAKSLIAQIGNVKAQLSQGQPEIKSSYQTLLRNRLTHIDDNLKIALSKAGVENTAQATPVDATSGSPIQRFLGYLTHSQYQLEHLSQTIESLNMTNAQMTPANMLAIQIKVGYVTQQIELFTSLLNKALESTKTIMNVQV